MRTDRQSTLCIRVCITYYVIETTQTFLKNGVDDNFIVMNKYDPIVVKFFNSLQSNVFRNVYGLESLCIKLAQSNFSASNYSATTKPTFIIEGDFFCQFPLNLRGK